jgi:hypothetical protein
MDFFFVFVFFAFCRTSWMSSEAYVWCFDHVEQFQVFQEQPHEIYTSPKPCLYFLRAPDMTSLFPRCVPHALFVGSLFFVFPPHPLRDVSAVVVLQLVLQLVGYFKGIEVESGRLLHDVPQGSPGVHLHVSLRWYVP